MAKGKPAWLKVKKDGKTVNKAGSIKAYDAENPGKTPKELKTIFEAQGITLTDPDIQNARNKGGSSKRATTKATNGTEALEAQLEAAKLVLKMGGIKQAKDALAKVADQPIFAFAVRAGSAEKAQQLIDQLAE